jgi:hypothetical protein
MPVKEEENVYIQRTLITQIHVQFVYAFITK